MNLTEQQLILIHSRINVLLAMDALRSQELREFGPKKLDILWTIIDRGYYWALNYFCPAFSFENDFKFLEERPPAVQETFEIFNMFRKHEDIRDQFQGFDGNHDEHYFVQDFIIEQLGLYKEVTTLAINSHSTILPHYRRLMDEHD